MRRSRPTLLAMLAFVPLLFVGAAPVHAGGRTVHGGVVIRSGVYADPFFWDPFWYPRFGWGVYYSTGPYGPPPSYGYGQVRPRNTAPVELHVSPRKATVVVDGTNVGQARDFDSRAYPLWLKAGTHDIELSYRGRQTLRVRFDVKRGSAYRVHYDLRDGEGLDPRSNRNRAEPPEDPQYD